MELIDTLDRDIRLLKNADTGGKVNTKVRLKDAQLMRKDYVSAVEKAMRGADIPDDVFDGLKNAVKSSEADIFSEDILAKKHKGLLN